MILRFKFCWVATAFAVVLTVGQPLAAQQPATGKLVFSQGAGTNELWTVDDNGANLVKILTMPSYIVSPRWSHDGARIAFQSGTQLWIVNPDGTGLQNVSSSVADGGLTWDGTSSGLVFSTVNFCSEFLSSISDNGTNNVPFHAAPGFPLFYPDARPGEASPYVAFHRYRCGAESTNEFRGVEITRQNGVDFLAIAGSPDVFRQQYPRWSRDGNSLLTSVRFLSNGQWAIEVLTPFVSSARVQYLPGPQGFSDLDFGCGTSQIFFSRDDDGSQDLRVLDTATTTVSTVADFSSGIIRGVDFHCVTPSGFVQPYFFDGSGLLSNPSTIFLDASAPTASSPRFRDSGAVNFSGGNLWKEIGTWAAPPALISGTVTALPEVRTWVGLKNSDDQGTRFDMRAEVYKGATLLAAGESLCVQGVTRNPSLAKEVTVPLSAIVATVFDGSTDSISVKISTRIGTNGAGGSCGGHSNAVGLRLYFDSLTRPSRLVATFEQQ